MLFIDILGLIGTAAFAVSGVLVGIKSRLDLFGVFVLAVFTASGGGLLRDIILKKGMPVLFTDSRYLITVFLSTVLACFLFRFLTKIHLFIQVFDALGLGVFTVLAAFECINLKVPLIGIIFISVLTGIGGCIIRDILVNNVPMVFKSEIYALASIVGAFAFYFLYKNIDLAVSMYVCILLVFAVRITAVYFNLNLPVLSPGASRQDTPVE